MSSPRQARQVLCHGQSLDYFLEELPCVHDVFDKLIAVQGHCFLEVFAGGCLLTLAIRWCSVPAFRPWDVAAGNKFDVLAFGHIIVELIDAWRISALHFGTPCRSMTWARQPQ